MNEQEKHAASQEERKEKIRARYKGVDRSELEPHVIYLRKM